MQYLSQKTNASCFVPDKSNDKRADLKSIGKLIESFDIQSEALNDFVKLCKTSNDIASIINHELFMKVSEFSRLEAETQSKKLY